MRESTQMRASLRSRISELPNAPKRETQGVCLGYHSDFSESPETEKDLRVDLGEIQPISSVVLVPARVPGTSQHRGAYGFPKRFRIEISDDESFSQPLVLADFKACDFPDPDRLPVAISGAGHTGRHVRLVVQKLNGVGGEHFFALGEMFVFGPGGRSLVSGAPFARSLSTDSFGSHPFWSRRNVFDGMSALGAATAPPRSRTHGWRAVASESATEGAWISIDLGRSVKVDEVRLHPAQPPNFPEGVSYAFPKRFVIEGAEEEHFLKPIVIFSCGNTEYPNPGSNPVCKRKNIPPVRFLRVRVTQRSEIKLQFECAFSEVEVFSEGRNVALGAKVTADSSDEQAPWGASALTDGFNSEAQLVGLEEWLHALSLRRELEAAAESVSAQLTLQEQAFFSALRRGTGFAALGITFTILGVWWRNRRARQREMRLLRERIARDLHDEIGSNLGTIAMLSQMALEANPDEPQIRSDMREIGFVAHQSVEAIRDLVWLLKRESSAPVDFLAEMQITAQNLLRGLEWSLSSDGAELPNPMPFELRRNLFLAFKEMLHNAAKHAAASVVRIQIETASGKIVLSVTDNGCGFDPSVGFKGVGLPSLKSRAQSLGGHLEVESFPSAGTTIRFVIPCSISRPRFHSPKHLLKRFWSPV